MLNAAAGTDLTGDDLEYQAMRSFLMFRAILIRNFGRNRKMEVEAVFPAITIPDTFGEVATWEEFNDLVDIYYDALGWDRETGWAHTRNYTKNMAFPTLPTSWRHWESCQIKRRLETL